jgi:ATP-dependent DNA helicase RecG
MTNLSVQSLKGIGASTATLLANLGIQTVSDLLEHFPLRYEDRTQRKSISELLHGEFGAFVATVTRGEVQRIKGKSIARLFVRDESGEAVLIWFNQPYRATTWKPGTRILVYGKANRFRDKIQIETPEVDSAAAMNSLNLSRIVPIYPSTQGLSARALRKMIAAGLEVHQALAETMPADILSAYGLMERSAALREIHFPTDWAMMKQAKRRIVFEEFYFLQCALAFIRQQRVDDRRSHAHHMDGKKIRQMRAALPFQLTNDQLASYEEIRKDMENSRPMYRLLQGDVGSGKTAVALMALVKTIENGLQGALMAPTEILAEQHFRSCSELMEGLGIRMAILTGRIKGSARKQILESVLSGDLDLLIGTHALLQPDVIFRQLGLAVIDEQHRFGVSQRATLSAKGEVPHTLIMSATPIPRTMALTIYGDMDISIIRQLPPGRKPITTAIRSGNEAREKVYGFLRSEVMAGRQGYVVCPLVEESEKLEAQSATAVFIELQSTFLRDIPCRLLHGRMNANEKESVMQDFSAGKIAVLVSTTVIEVGINVPLATMMIVEDASRFGLSQLHQLRGRVGRGSMRSYCVLLHNADTGPIPERLRVLAETNDGFIVAEKDLAIRGPGQFLGYRQHGLPEMKMASLADDLSVMEEARAASLKTIRNPHELAIITNIIKHKFDRFLGILFAG